MKFLHCADIHLDSPLTGLRARADLPPEITRHCTRRALAAMIDLALAEDVAFVVIAGDLYDGDWKDFSTGLFFAEQMRRLGRPCYLLRGNHDARSIITSKLRLPDNVREFSSRTCETFSVPGLPVVLHGHSFPNRAVPEDLSATYPAARPGHLNIGVLHTSAEDPGEHEPYAPCSPAALALKGYGYWALGHIHKRRELSRRPWIVFPGNLQGRHPNETGAKGCSIVTVEDTEIVDVTHRAVDVLRWAALEIDVTGADEPTLIARLADHVAAALADAEGRPILARLTLTGRTDLHDLWRTQADRLAAECRNAAIAADADLWVDSVRLRTEPVVRPMTGRLDELHAAYTSSLEDPALIAGLLEHLAALRQKLPGPAREGADLPQTEAQLRTLAALAWSIAADALAHPEQP
jgi:DNA repair exonuclease SbcCD nuclease subunit